MKYPVKVIRCTMRGAPVRNGTPGSTINVLDAALVNGFGLVTALSLTIVDGVATAVLNTNEGFEKGTTVWVEGAGLPSMNEEQRVTSVTSNSISWKTLEANQTVTGTITVKVAPLGWLKPFAGTSKGVYQSGNVLSTKTFLRVDDTFARSTQVIAYEHMTDVDTGFEQTPPVGFAAWWRKAAVANTTARDWMVIGCDKWFFFVVNSADRDGGIPMKLGQHVHFAGDYKKNPDFVTKNNFFLHSCTLQTTAEAEGNGTETLGYLDVDASSTSRSRWIRRNYTGVPGATRVYLWPHINGSAGYSGSNFFVPFPNPSDGGLRLADINLYDSSHVHYGSLPCVKAVGHNNSSITRNANMSILPGAGNMLGRDLLMVKVNNYLYSDSSEGIIAFDITGPFE